MGSFKRGQLRAYFENPCILTHHGKSYLGLLENLSSSGAFLKVANREADSFLFIGDTVALKLCINPDSCHVEHLGTVVRFDSSGLGVLFEK
jgi:hypothetical protein